MSGPSRIVCASCGATTGRNIVRMSLEFYDLISHETGHARVITVDAAVACSTRCMATYLTEFEKNQKEREPDDIEF